MTDDPIRGAFEPFGKPYDSHIMEDPRDAKIARLTRDRDEWRALHDADHDALGDVNAANVRLENALRDAEDRLERIVKAIQPCSGSWGYAGSASCTADVADAIRGWTRQTERVDG